MPSSFMYSGPEDQILQYLQSALSDKDHPMITQMTPEWRNAVVYVLGRSKSKSYLISMRKAYEAGVLNTISPDIVLSGSGGLEDAVVQKLA